MLSSNTHTIAQVLTVDTTNINNVTFRDVCTDTRKRMDGALFIALVGECFDAHNYVSQAQKMGAVALVVSKKVNSSLPTLLVENTQTALSVIASWHLQNIKPIVIAITGSNGKTTTKNILKNILDLKAPTLATKGNFNNHFGVPMTLLKLEAKHQYAVIEMGANHLGEIAHLCTIAPPDIAVVTNTLNAHIGEFGGFDNLVKTKGEIYTQNSKKIINTATRFNGDISFGDKGDIFASNIDNNKFNLNIFAKEVTVILRLLGKHNIDNALAASACSYALGIDIDTIRQGIENTEPEKGRLNIIQHSDLTIIDDSYNASPSSSKYALEVLNSFAGEKIAVLGQMAELGDKSNAYHRQVGNFAKSLNIDPIYSFQSDYGVQNFDNEDDLVLILKQQPNATILFKGSRVAKLEQIIKKLCV